ncbi:ankyrin repeat-containing domain protein [Lactarius quietus]|nr:ankyrin repeat-containing domain protein [Lactarius quietus]
MCLRSPIRPVYIILDALDECPTGLEFLHLVNGSCLVKELVNLHLPHLHICVTSRPEFDIRATLTPLTRHRVSLHDESGQKKDIIDYVNSVVHSDSETVMKRWREDDKKMVVDTLSEKADGIRLPESLDETYERIVLDIRKGNQADAYRMLQCLTVAIRPLSVAELAEILALDFDGAKEGIPKLNSKWRWEDHEQPLITIIPTDDSPVVQFSHFSVKEFLLSDRLAKSTKDTSRYHIAFENANTLIARACLGVLLRDPVNDNDAATGPLARYAAEHWVSHAKVENVASRIRNGMESLFDPDQPYFSAWVKLYDVNNQGGSPGLEDKIQPGAAPLYYAAFIGFPEIVEHVALKYPQYTNAISGQAGTALHSASDAGHVEVVRSLIKCGANVDARGVRDMSSLHLASFKGHFDVVQCLLDHGADANFQEDYHKTPLLFAAAYGHLEIVRVLLEHNVDANFQDSEGRTPLHRILWWGDSEGDYPQIVRLLLQHGANPNARDNERRTHCI